MTNSVPDFVGKGPPAAAVVVTALDVGTVLEVETGSLGTEVAREEDTGAFEADMLTNDAESGTHCEYQSFALLQRYPDTQTDDPV